jgi:hypothetical protein
MSAALVRLIAKVRNERMSAAQVRPKPKNVRETLEEPQPKTPVPVHMGQLIGAMSSGYDPRDESHTAYGPGGLEEHGGSRERCGWCSGIELW